MTVTFLNMNNILIVGTGHWQHCSQHD